MLDGCPVNDRQWVFAAGLTDVAVDLTVRYTPSGATQVYRSAGGPFRPVQDTQAFAVCN